MVQGYTCISYVKDENNNVLTDDLFKIISQTQRLFTDTARTQICHESKKELYSSMNLFKVYRPISGSTKKSQIMNRIV